MFIQPKRLLTPNRRTSYDAGVSLVKTGQMRPRQAEGIIMYIYGDMKQPEDRCVDCKKGNGPFDGCVMLKQFAKGCATCNYGSAESACRFGDPDLVPSRDGFRKRQREIKQTADQLFQDELVKQRLAKMRENN
ncbi:hypothetical protein PWT90_01390 [Aphanocladium album]|nr:hypothetical protein PWT90_01390 [Aphanocladium album]